MFLGIRTLNISNEAYARQPKGCRIVVSGRTVMMVQAWRDEPCRDRARKHNYSRLLEKF